MILDGKVASKGLFLRLQEGMLKQLSFTPTLAVVQVGDNPASTTYIKLKKKKLEELSLGFKHVKFDQNVSQETVTSSILELNNDNNINGIILQLPLPEHLDSRTLIDLIAPSKDTDCLTSINLGAFLTGSMDLLPATPLGVIRMLDFYNIELDGKRVCIIGRSNLVGKPLALALTQRNATVTLCHSKTKNTQEISRAADIVITASGTPHFFGKEYFSCGQSVIDVGTTKTDSGLHGDVDFDQVVSIVKNISPVPGGVGPMTIYGLIENLVKLSLNQIIND